MEMKPGIPEGYQEQQDREHLKLLSILFYVMAGLSALSGCFPFLYLGFGLVMLGGAATGMKPEHEDRTGMLVAGGVMVGFAIFFVLFLLVQAYLLYRTGKNLTERRHHTFCMVIAAICCLNAPLGTALGIFTIIVLQRPTVKLSFDADFHRPFATPPPRY
ncbi:hypothetical protein ETAA8_65840 [Anatilimnocola aggregata]|uniref:Uncharacterized protein n=1 Tax=Anatilimnocola aggregata TaxID=2528021 RepID=A0A517YMJ0_9BACT|nr:hypothetical protein [Anatilimnocola aggregata]QDU31426.1 hypothetical protein ETAA8_65840 [Anatilimnocola aggregata]